MSADEETRKMKEHFTTGLEEKRCAWGSRMMKQLPEEHPVMIAWQAYKNTPEYTNTRKWALKEKHVDGSLWAAFSAGFLAKQASST